MSKDTHRLYVPIITLYENRLQVYERDLWSQYRTRKKEKSQTIGKNLKYTGKMTRSGKKTIERRLTSWLLAMECYNKRNSVKGKRVPHKPVFITLTLSEAQKHTDYYIKRNMLQVFLKDLQYNFNVINYFWKAERQKNGNIHFHILVDKFIQMNHVRSAWNRIQYKHGYTEKYRNEYGSHNPPSTHVEGQPTKGSICQYVMKYVSKHDNEQCVEGSVYRFSKSLLALKPFSEIAMGSFSDIIQRFIDSQEIKVYKNDFCTTYYFAKIMVLDGLPEAFKTRVENYYCSVYKAIYDDKEQKKLGVSTEHRKEKRHEQGDLFGEGESTQYIRGH